MVVRFQQAAFGGQRVAQVVQQLPEIGARLGFAGFRPEQRGQLFARLRRIAVQQQPGEQRLQPAGVDRQDGLLRTGDQQIVK